MNQLIDPGPGGGAWHRRGRTIILDDSFAATHTPLPPSDQPARRIPMGELTVPSVPLLAGHRGNRPDLILRWNVSSVPTVIDVVVHLHGYWYPTMCLARDILPVSGLDLAPVGGAPGQGRSRPTLTVLPRGHDTGVKQRWKQKDGSYKYGYNKFSFPALVARDGFSELVRLSLDQFAAKVGGAAPRVDRLILTAHSGGGASLLRILTFCDPHQVHVFDGLYQDAGALAKWACRRIVRDRAALLASGTQSATEYMSTRGGALRVFYGGGTRDFSRKLRAEIATVLDPGMEAWYRVEASKYGHFAIPSRYGWRVLADASADVPDAYTETVTHREVDLEDGVDATVTFPSGAALRVVSGATGKGEEHFDPWATGNPLLDAGPLVRATQLSRSFTVGELARSGGRHFDTARIDPKLIRCLQQLRDHVGKPVRVLSGYRPYVYNTKLYRERKKVPTESRHSSGQAADVVIAGMTGMEIAKAAIDACGPNLGVGIASGNAHVDVRGKWGRWTYFGKGTEKDRLAIAEIEEYRRRRMRA